jgi:uncharacterized membrane protein YhiD involved in acid resistance
MNAAIDVFGGFEDLTGTFSVADIALAMVLSFVLSAAVGWVYRATHKGVSYSQSFVQTTVLLGMLVSLVMLVVGSNIARAFSLVGALSIVRFRNAVKETRDVGFIFFAMAIGMATGTRFYTLAAVATVVIGGAVMLMNRLNWFALDVQTQIVKVQLPPGAANRAAIEEVLASNTRSSDLISAESVRAGTMTELLYSVVLKKGASPTALIDLLSPHTSGEPVTVLTGYDRSEL